MRWTFGDFLRLNEEIHGTGKRYSAGSLSWMAEADVDTVTFEIECRRGDAAKGENETLALFLLDRNGERAPWSILVSGGAVHDKWNAACVASSEKDGVLFVTARIPRALLGSDDFRFGIEHYWTDGGKTHSEHYPPGDYPNEQRLNLGFFTPDRTIRIRL